MVPHGLLILWQYSWNNSVHSGYKSKVFKEKEQQMLQVAQNLKDKGFIPAELVDNEVSWFYS